MLSIPSGWDDLILKLDNELSAIDPNYKILQAKEKFGTARFYYITSDNLLEENRQAFYNLVKQAEVDSAHICQRCGNKGSFHMKDYWYATLCKDCATKEEYKPYNGE